MPKLENELDERFCQEYLIDVNGVRSYQRAFKVENYGTAAVEASKKLKNPNIRIRIRELMDDRSKDTLIDAKYVVDSLVEIKQRCMQQEPVLKFDYVTNEMVETGEYKFDSIGANKAAELLGKHVGMFNDKLKLEHEFINPETLKEIVDKLNTKDE
jgi:phage terminase small subunit